MLCVLQKILSEFLGVSNQMSLSPNKIQLITTITIFTLAHIEILLISLFRLFFLNPINLCIWSLQQVTLAQHMNCFFMTSHIPCSSLSYHFNFLSWWQMTSPSFNIWSTIADVLFWNSTFRCSSRVTLFVQAFRIGVDAWNFSMLLLYISWDNWRISMISASNEQLQQQWEYTLLKPDCHRWWISKMQSGLEDTLEERYAIKFSYKLGKMSEKRMECVRFILDHLA